MVDHAARDLAHGHHDGLFELAVQFLAARAQQATQTIDVDVRNDDGVFAHLALLGSRSF
jgi:hypothetical protein